MKSLLLFLSLLLPVMCFAQGGNVVLNGTVIHGNGTSPANYTAANTIDGNFLTAFSAPTGTGNGPWVGMDAGQPVTLVSVLGTPRAGNATVIYALNWAGCVIEGSVSDATFASPDLLYTIPSWVTGMPDVYSSLQKSFPVSPTKAYRYYRFRDPANNGAVGELRFIVQYVSGLTAMPVAPVITPGSGAFLSGSVTVSMSTATTGSTIYYTTNGTAPTCGTSTLYSGPVAITAGSGPPAKVQAVACNSGLSTTQSLDVGTQYYRNYDWKAGDLMYDDGGNQLNITAGSLTWAEGKWWWIGMNQQWGGSSDTFAIGHPGIWEYSSPDMVTWTKVGQVMQTYGYVHDGRSFMLFNALNNNYVLWVHGGPIIGTPNGDFVIVLTAPHPQGPWTASNTAYDPGNTSGTYVGIRDHTMFVDTNGTGYLALIPTAETSIWIMQLNASYTATVGSATVINGSREGMAMFKRGSTYFLLSSQPTNASLTNDNVQYQTSTTTPLGTWSALSGTNTFYTQLVTSTVYNAQPSQVIKLPWMQNAYLFLGDSWNMVTVTTPAGDSWFTTANTSPLFLPINFQSATAMTAPTLGDTPAPFNISTQWSYSGMFPMPGAMAR